MRGRRGKRLVVSLVVSAGMVTVSVVAPPGAAGRPEALAATSHPCATAVKRCDGTIRVPLDWSNHRSKRITVDFAWLPRRDRAHPATGTIMANPGGPGEAIGDMPLFQRSLGPVLDHQNLLIVDPRGFGRSNPLRCKGSAAEKPAWIRACARSLGASLRYFTSDQAVADMDAVRRALRVPRVTFYGNSYGTVFGQAYATRFPASTAAVYLDSVVESRRDGYMRDPIRTGIDMLDYVCRRSPACRSLPGRAVDRWAELLRRLRAHPDPKVTIAYLTKLTGAIDEPVNGYEANAAAYAYVHHDVAPLRRLAREWKIWEGATPPDDYASDSPATLSYSCGDFRYPFDRNATVTRRIHQLRRYYQTHRPFRPYAAAEVGADYPDWCANWPTPRPSPPVPPNAVYPKVPVLVVNGALDLSTPPGGARKVAARFPRSRYVEIPFGSHASGDGQAGGYAVCVRDFVRAFLTRPEASQPYPGCSAETYRARGAFPRSLADVRPAIAEQMGERDGRLVAASYATAADVLVRRTPAGEYSKAITGEPGLRGGTVRYGKARTIRLDRVEFAAGLPVSGTVDYDQAGRATATLRAVTGDGKERRLTLRWRAFQATNSTAVTGSLNGRPFSAAIPAT